MIVYRVESTEYVDPRTGLGAGPFAGMWYCAADDERWQEVRELLLDALKEARERGTILPTPSNDPLLGGIFGDEVCGVGSLDGVRKWFPRIKEILTKGYSVVKYDVPDEYVRVGIEDQVVFQFAHIKSRTEEEYK
jgi:hypothetical protein